MPVTLERLSLGQPPSRIIERGPRAGESVPIFQVRFPGWDDIIHLVPTGMLTSEERRARQLRQITDLRNSPTPEIAQHFTQLATQIDNIQDGLVTLSVLGRVAETVAGRVLPGVGAIATAADVLNAINIFYPPLPGIHSLPSITHIRAFGRRLRRWPQSLGTKRELGILSGLATGTYRQRLAETRRTGKIGFGWGEALQVLQVTDQFAGFGLSLGPIFGSLTDAFFGYLRGARFDVSGPLQFAAEALDATAATLLPQTAASLAAHARAVQDIKSTHIQIDWPGVFPLIDDVYLQPHGTFERDVATVLDPVVKAIDPFAASAAQKLTAVNNAAVSAAKVIWDASKWLVGVRGVLSWDDHIELLTAQHLALNVFRPYLKQQDWGEIAAKVALQPEISLPYAPGSMTSSRSKGEVSAVLRDGPARLSLEWVEEAPTPEAKIFTHSLIDSFVDLLFDALEGPLPRKIVRSSDSARALLALHDLNLLPPFSRSDEELSSYIARVTDIVREHDSVIPPFGLVAQAWRDSFPGEVLD